MSLKELDTIIKLHEEETTIYPTHFTRLTLDEFHKKIHMIKYTDRLKSTENRKRQAFEQLLRTKTRKLLVIKSYGYR
jgi:hypothetical protein